MWVNVHLEDAVLPVEVGEGRQRLQWLAKVACIRYGLLQNGLAHQFVPMRMERQPREGEVLPNARSRVLHPHITVWVRDTSQDEKLHFSDSVLAGSVPAGDHAFHLTRLQSEAAWSKGFEVGKGQSGQDALRHVIHIAAYSRKIDQEEEKPHHSLWHVVNPSITSLVTTDALHEPSITQDTVIWSKRFQEAWDKTDIFDILVKHDSEEGRLQRGPNLGTNQRMSYSPEQQKLLLDLGQLLYDHFEVLAKIFDHEAIVDDMSGPDTMGMLGFFNMLKKCYVPHPEVPMSQLDRIFVEVNWSSDAPRDHSARSMDLGEFMEGLIRVAEVRYAVEDPPVPLLERLEKLLLEKILPNATEPFADPFRQLLQSKPFRVLLVQKRLPLLKGFKAFAVTDPDMSFHTMSLREWTSFVEILQLGKRFKHRQNRDTFWRAQGAFGAPAGVFCPHSS
jgi:hypothetical protein